MKLSVFYDHILQAAERLKALRHVKTADRRHFSAPLTKQKRLYKIKYNLCIQ